MLKTVILILLAAAALACLIFAAATRHFRVWAYAALAGFVLLVVLTLTKYFWGFGLYFNFYTLGASVFLGPSGPIALLFLNLL